MQHRTPSEIILDEIDRLLQEHSPEEPGLVLVPDTWGPHRRALLADHLGSDVAVRRETAALLELTRDSGANSSATAPVLIVRVGSDTTSASVHEHSDGGWSTCHRAETDWGGHDLDDLLVSFVRTRLLDHTPADVVRRECILARERLSTEIHADVCGVRIHRADLDDLARDGLTRALGGTLTSVLQELPAPPDRIWLAGGVTAMPLVAQLVSEFADRPVRLLDWMAVTVSSPSSSIDAEDEPWAETGVLAAPPAAPKRPLSGATVVDLASSTKRPRADDQRRRFRLLGLIAAGVALVAFAGAAFLQPGGAGAVLAFMIGSGSAQPNPAGPPPAHAATRGPAATPTTTGLPQESSATAGPGVPGLLANQVPAADGTPGIPLVDPSGSPAATGESGPTVIDAPAPEALAPGAAPPPAGSTGAVAPPPAPVSAPTTRPVPAPAPTEGPPPPPPAPTTEAPADPPTTEAPPAEPTDAAAEQSVAESTGDPAP